LDQELLEDDPAMSVLHANLTKISHLLAFRKAASNSGMGMGIAEAELGIGAIFFLRENEESGRAMEGPEIKDGIGIAGP
jgi:hypothetical protein